MVFMATFAALEFYTNLSTLHLQQLRIERSSMNLKLT